MSESNILKCQSGFSETLFNKMKLISPALKDLEQYEFLYCLDNLTPEKGWESVKLDSKSEIQKLVNTLEFYKYIQINHKEKGQILLDKQIIHLAQMLFVGLVTGFYDQDWIKTHFYFDVRGFFFLHRTIYFTEKVLAHFCGKPFIHFEQKQKRFEQCQGVGYKEFKEANAEVDACFIRSMMNLITFKKTPIVLAIAGPTAAGKTEIVERLSTAFEEAGQHVTSIELDNFLTDRDYREEKGIDSEGKQALHFDLFKQALEDITQGKKISIPRYDFIYATSSHDINGNQKPDGVPVEIEPADIIFIEGNFPFLLDEVVHLIGIKVVYLTDDAVRLKRKWKRDVDYRKKYDVNYFRNRYFKDQFIMAQIAYIPQMEICDMTVDTTGAAIWASPEISKILGSFREDV
jgi:uridine kinase